MGTSGQVRKNLLETLSFEIQHMDTSLSAEQ